MVKEIETHEELARFVELGDKYQYNIPNGSKVDEEGRVTYKFVRLELYKAMGREIADAKAAKAEASIVIGDAKKYLESTDWVVAKIGEMELKGEDISILIQQYAAELVKREEARAIINRVEQEMKTK